jgi:hypothetical protein
MTDSSKQNVPERIKRLDTSINGVEHIKKTVENYASLLAFQNDISICRESSKKTQNRVIAENSLIAS